MKALVALCLVLAVYGCAGENPVTDSGAALAEPAATDDAATAAVSQPSKPFSRASGTGPAVWGPGDLYTFLASGEETNNAFAQMEALVPKGGGPPPHVHHGEDESFYVIHGTLDVLIGDEIVSAKAGDYVFIPSGTVHRFENVGEEGLEVIPPPGETATD